ncbi:MAG: hypothetical protein Fur0011_0790 [Candidatus Microgenomates bacterium]
MTDNHDPSGFISGLTLGLILGAAGSHYLNNTEAGKEVMENLKAKAGNTLESVKANPMLMAKLSELEKTMEAAKATINAAAERVVEATGSTSPKTKKKSFFQKMGVSLKK